MFYLLLFFSIVTLGAGVFVIGFGVPIRDTPFGSALLISGTIAIVGGFLLVGLAGAVRELRRVVQSVRRMPGPRPVRPVDRKEGDRRPPPQRALFPNRPGPDAPIPPPDSVDEPPFDADSDPEVREAGARTEARADTGSRTDQRPPERKPGPAWLRRAIAEIESIPRPVELPAPASVEPPVASPETPPYDEPQPGRRYAPDDEPQPGRHRAPAEPLSARPAPNPGERLPMQDGWVRPRGPAAPVAPAEPLEDFAPEPEPPPRQPSAPPPSIFDMVWANDRRRPTSESAPPPEPRVEPKTRPAVRPIEPRPAPPVQPVPPPAPPAPAAAPPPAPPPRPEPRSEPRSEPRPLSILKSGVIDEMAYTLFTDGSIEAQMPDGTMRFSSIEELRRHLDQNEG